MAAPRRLLSSMSPAALGFTAAAGAGVVAYNMSKPSSSPAEPQKSLGQKPVFPAMGFVSLTLEEARMVNHDTRELKFKLPGDGAISGLSPVCEYLLQKQKPGNTQADTKQHRYSHVTQPLALGSQHSVPTRPSALQIAHTSLSSSSSTRTVVLRHISTVLLLAKRSTSRPSLSFPTSPTSTSILCLWLAAQASRPCSRLCAGSWTIPKTRLV